MANITREEALKRYEKYRRTAPEPTVSQEQETDVDPIISGVGTGLRAIGTGAVDFAKGAGKGLASTVINTGSMGAKGLDYVFNQGRNVESLGQTQQNFNQFNAPKNTAETLGFAAEQIGEYFTPVGAEKAAFKAIAPATKLGKIATGGLVTGLSTAGVTGLQTGGDIKKMTESFGLGAVAGSLARAVEVFGPGIITGLKKSGFRLTSLQQAKAPAKIQSAAEFMTKNKVSGSSNSKFAQLSKLNDDLESALQKSLGKDKKTFSVATERLISELDEVPKRFINEPAIYSSVKNDAELAKKVLQETRSYKGLTLPELLSGKRSYSQSAFGKSQAGFKGSLVRSEGDYAIEQAYQNVLEGALQSSNRSISIPSGLRGLFDGKKSVGIKEFNRVYSDAITAKKLMNVSRFKKDTGLFGRLFGLWVGQAVGQTVSPGLAGQVIGGGAGEVLSTRLPGTARYLIEKGIGATGAVLPATRTGLGLQSSLNKR